MLNKEPTAIIMGTAGFVTALLPLLVTIKAINLSTEQLAGWTSIIGLTATFVGTVILRSQVTPTETANKQIQTAIDAPKGSTTVEEVIKDTANKEEGK